MLCWQWGLRRIPPKRRVHGWKVCSLLSFPVEQFADKRPRTFGFRCKSRSGPVESGQLFLRARSPIGINAVGGSCTGHKQL